MSISLRSHGPQQTKLPCPSLSLGACSNSCPLSRWLHPSILSSVTPFFCLQSFLASSSFSINQLFASSGQSIVALASVLSVNIQGWAPLGLAGLISLVSKGLLSLLQHHSSSTSILQCSALLMVQVSHQYMITGQTIALTIWTLGFSDGSDGKESACNAVDTQQMQVWSLGLEDPHEEEMVIPSNILPWRIPWTEEPGGLQSMGSQRVGHDWMTNTNTWSFVAKVMCLLFIMLSRCVVDSLVAEMVKKLPAMQETQVLSLGWKDSGEKGKGNHSSILGLEDSIE